MTTEPASAGDADARLLRAVADGDEAALRALYERHAAWLFARLLRRCNDEDLVADVLQDALAAAAVLIASVVEHRRGSRIVSGRVCAPHRC